ncbi:DUF5667 domain-containing protein [Chloroflexota bacterium]
MADNFDKILDECIDRINHGESLESCLSDYSQYAEQLEPLLIAIFQTKEAYSFQPSGKAKRAARQRFNHAREKLARVREEKQSLFLGVLDVLDRSKTWVMVAASVFALVILSVGIVAASNNSLPGGLLYPVKTAMEQARLALTFSEAEKARLHIAFAEHRMEEITEMSQRGEIGQIAKLTPTLEQHIEDAEQVILAIDESQVAQELKINLEESADQQLSNLEGTLQQATEDTKSLITQALEDSAKSYGIALEATLAGSISPSLVGKVGTIQILVTNLSPIEEIDSVIVQIDKIEVYLAGGPDSGWIIVMDEQKSFDLMGLIGGKEVELGSMEVNAGTYTQVQIEITNATVTVDGEEHDAPISSETLNFIRPFRVEEDGTISLILGFDGQKSIKVTDQGWNMIKPVVTLLVPKIEEEEVE